MPIHGCRPNDDAAMDDLAFAEVASAQLGVEESGEIVAGGGKRVGHIFR